MTNNIDQVFNTDDPNIIAEIIINEVNRCIETISPSKRIQCTKKHCKWYTPALTKLAEYKNKIHKIAKSSNSETDWRIFRNIRNKYNNLVKETKSKYYSQKLTINNKNIANGKTNNNGNNINNKNNNIDRTNNTHIKPEVSIINKLWTTVKELTNTSTKAPPRNIIHENSVITSLRKISNIASNHFINKIIKKRNNFTPSTITHTQILEQLITKPKCKFILPHITIKQTKKLIRKMKSSNSTGHDSSSIKIYKLINNRISPHITHLINCIINTGVYPKILKISRITPIKNPDKPDVDIDLYRPINNLATLEKIVEQHIKMHLETYLCTNNIILKYHHGSRKFHGTNTAITHITNEINTDYENNLITATVATDLSCTIYTNETPLLHTLMSQDIYYALTNT